MEVLATVIVALYLVMFIAIFARRWGGTNVAVALVLINVVLSLFLAMGVLGWLPTVSW